MVGHIITIPSFFQGRQERAPRNCINIRRSARQKEQGIPVPSFRADLRVSYGTGKRSAQHQKLFTLTQLVVQIENTGIIAALLQLFNDALSRSLFFHLFTNISPQEILRGLVLFG